MGIRDIEKLGGEEHCAQSGQRQHIAAEDWPKLDYRDWIPGEPRFQVQLVSGFLFKLQCLQGHRRNRTFLRSTQFGRPRDGGAESRRTTSPACEA